MYTMAQVELNNMYIRVNICANNGSEKLWTKKNTANSIFSFANCTIYWTSL